MNKAVDVMASDTQQSNLKGHSMVGSGAITGAHEKTWCMLFVDAVVIVAMVANLCKGEGEQPRKSYDYCNLAYRQTCHIVFLEATDVIQIKSRPQ